jgi:hypothetical protein
MKNTEALSAATKEAGPAVTTETTGIYSRPMNENVEKNRNTKTGLFENVAKFKYLGTAPKMWRSSNIWEQPPKCGKVQIFGNIPQ